MVLLYLGENLEGVQIRAPGAHHRARWMCKIIYSLKIYLFRSQFNLIVSELKGLRIINNFIVELYLKNWYTAPSSVTATRNDLKLLKDLKAYAHKNQSLSKAEALKTFSHHLWYLNEHLIGLTFFGPKVPNDMKVKMVLSLNHKEGSEVPSKRVRVASEDISGKQFSDFVTKKNGFLLRRSANPTKLFTNRSEILEYE